MPQFFKPSLKMALLGARLIVAFAALPLVFAAFAHEAHPPAQQTGLSDEKAFLAENDAAMDEDDGRHGRSSRPATSTAISSR